jgi:outer membrane protein OmpA-like peptidoglycan-associated protein
MHHIDVINAKTGTSIPSPLIRLNGHPSRQDTALRLEQPITLQISATGFLFYDTLFNSGKDEETHTIQVALQPLEKDLVLQLRNIQFAYDSYELTADSYHELNQLLNLLQQNPTLRIELSAHTDDTGNDRYNDKLSTLRGETVQRWLISQGIESSRIQSKGYGKRKPLVPNTSDENRALNRRVEIKVIEY